MSKTAHENACVHVTPLKSACVPQALAKEVPNTSFTSSIKALIFTKKRKKKFENSSSEELNSLLAEKTGLTAWQQPK